MAEGLLDAVRVLDVSGGASGENADGVTRLLADLGADVLKVEPPGGSPAREVPPTLAGVSLAFAVHNANKRSTELNPDDENDRERFLELVAGADIVVDCGRPGQAATCVVISARAAEEWAASAEPALKPNQPNQRTPAPITVRAASAAP